MDPALIPITANPAQVVEPPARAASASYATVWPNVRYWASAIVQKCVQRAAVGKAILNEGSNMGVVMTFSLLGEFGFRFEYYVTVIG